MGFLFRGASLCSELCVEHHCALILCVSGSLLCSDLLMKHHYAVIYFYFHFCGTPFCSELHVEHQWRNIFKLKKSTSI